MVRIVPTIQGRMPVPALKVSVLLLKLDRVKVCMGVDDRMLTNQYDRYVVFLNVLTGGK